MNLRVELVDSLEGAVVRDLCYSSNAIAPDRAQEEFERFLHAPCGWATVVRDGEEGRYLGLVTGALIHPSFQAVLGSNGHPFIHNHVRRRIKFGDPVFLADSAEANARLGSTMLLGHFGLAPGLTDSERREVGYVLWSGFADQAAGDRVNSIWLEALGTRNVRDLMSVGFVPRPGYAGWNPNEKIRLPSIALCEIDLEAATRSHNLPARRILTYRPPIIGLPPALREYATLALRGLTRHEIALALGCQPSSVDGRRQRLFALIVERTPADSLLQKSAQQRDSAAVMQFLRLNPSELRPYRPISGGNDERR